MPAMERADLMKTKLNSIPSDYPSLLKKVKEALIEGQRRIESERVRTYWETGRIIHGHILKHADRAEYGAQVMMHLAQDMDVDKSQLNRCVQFYTKYPRLPIVGGRQQFTWTHYRKLIAVADDKKRTFLEEAASRNAWTADELGQRIKLTKQSPETEPAGKPVIAQTPLAPLRGELYTYRLITRPTLGAGKDSGLLIDLGFGFFREVENRWVEGDIVRSRPAEDSYKFSKIEATVKELFTYAAFVEKVIDGDTLKVRLDLGFESWTRQTLRLRGIDCPEVETKAGQEARVFVQARLKESQRIIVRTSRSDKYDRYLADVFIPATEEGEDVFLNNALLKEGHAVRG